MAIDYTAVLKNERIRALLGKEKIADAQEDEGSLSYLVDEEGKNVLCLGWDGGGPGSAGAHYITEWNGLYFFFSSDLEEEGPFDRIEDALELECFHFPTAEPELSSDVLPMERLLGLGRELVQDDEPISINGENFVLNQGKLVPEEISADS
jgi:hypothetical protein